jgi:hypothetical protein
MRIAKVSRPKVRFYHIAHGEKGATCSQARQGRRVDQWNRDSGFCPVRTLQNRRARRFDFWTSPSWGMPEALPPRADGPKARGPRLGSSPLEPAPVPPPGREISTAALPGPLAPGA